MNSSSLLSLLRSIRNIAGLCAVTASAACAAPTTSAADDADVTETSAQEIRGGTDVNPWDLIGRSVVQIETDEGYCTGVVIDSRHVLTAAHCKVTTSAVIRHFTGKSLNGDQNFVFSILPAPTVVNLLADAVIVQTVFPINTWLYTPAELPAASHVITPSGTYYAVGQGRHEGVAAVGTLKWVAATVFDTDPVDKAIRLTSWLADSGDSGGPLLEYIPERRTFRVLGLLKGRRPAADGPAVYSNLVELRKLGWPY